MKIWSMISVLLAVFGSPALPTAAAQPAQEPELIRSVRSGDSARWRALLAGGTDLAVQDDLGNTALHLAAYLGDAAAVDALIGQGAKVNAVNQEGATPLIYGVGSEPIVRSLLRHGANPNLASKLQITALQAAVVHQNSHRVVALLLQAGADVHAKQDGGENILYAAVSGEDPQTIALLLARGARIQPAKAVAASPLANAVYFGNVGIVNQLLAHGADVNFDGDFAGPTLNWALYTGRPEIAALLIQKGADLHLKSDWGHQTSPMVFAGYGQLGDPTVARMLVERGANVNEANEMGETALSFALRSGPETPLVAYLRQVGAKEPKGVPSAKSRGARRMAPEVPILERAQKAIDLLQRASTGFIDNRFVHDEAKCVSCHHQDLPAVAIAWGSDRGLRFDQAALGHQLEAQLAMWRPRAEHAREMDDPFADSPVQIGYGLMALHAVGYAPDAMTESLSRFLLAGQSEDGSWHWTDLRPPLEGGRFTATAWAVHAIQLYPPPRAEAQIGAAFARAREWLRNNQPQTFGDQVQRLAGLGWAEESPTQLQKFAQAIVALQRPGGGWSQLPGLEPDAWATGEALVALHAAGCLSPTDPVFRRGVQFLLDTEFEDGSWWVHSRTWPFQPHFDSGFPHGNDQWISAGGTAWATMALLLTVEPKGSAGSLPSPNALIAVYHRSVDAAKLASAGAAVPTGVPTVDFARQVYPALERSCVKCHSGEKPKAGLSLVSRDGLLKGGKSGEPAVVPGHGTDSAIVAYASDQVEDFEMPPLTHRDEFQSLTQPEITLIRTWIDEGANWNLPAAKPKS
jgi:ankyrin repeat protein